MAINSCKFLTRFDTFNSAQRLFLYKVLLAIGIWLLIDSVVGVDNYLTNCVARVAVFLIENCFNDKVDLDNKILLRGNFRISQLYIIGTHVRIGIGHSCNGKEILFLFSAFICALPYQTLSRTVLFIIGGSLVLSFVNSLRVAFLYKVMRDAPAWFEIAHKNIFQLLMYVIMVLLWLLFLKKK